jgi:hypothetical protein
VNDAEGIEGEIVMRCSQAVRVRVEHPLPSRTLKRRVTRPPATGARRVTCTPARCAGEDNVARRPLVGERLAQLLDGPLGVFSTGGPYRAGEPAPGPPVLKKLRGTKGSLP